MASSTAARVILLATERARRIDEPFPGGQSYRQVLAATDAFLHELATHWNRSRILVIAHSANRWALDCLLTGASLQGLVQAPFNWQPGWSYTLPEDWPAPEPNPPTTQPGERSRSQH